MRVLAIDPGGQRVGFAVGDDASGVVTPRGVAPWRGVDAGARHARALVEELGAALVVIGLPTDADGGDTPACRRSRALAHALENLGVRVVLQPELLTTD